MNPRSNTGLRHLFGALFLCLFSIGVFAETSIAILDFDLNDQTLIPRTPAEIQRTASIKPMLEGELKRAGYKIISVDLNVQHVFGDNYPVRSGDNYLDRLTDM